MADPTGIEIRNLYKIFGARPERFVESAKQGMSKAELNSKHAHILGLRDINLSIAPASIQVIMGLSGSGKSTLLRHINRLIEPTAGEIVINGTDIVKLSPADLQAFRRETTAMVFQKFALLPHRSIIDNVLFGLEIKGTEKAQARDRGMFWLERVGLKGFEGKYPAELSGGMQQRVGLARALANDAPILLMDEAYSALDPLIRTDMQTMLLDLQRELKKTIIFITHDLDEALRLGDSIAILRDGELIQQGSRQDIVLRPADDYVATFVAEVNRAKVVTVGALMTPHSGDQLLSVKAGATVEQALEIMTSAEQERLQVTTEEGAPLGEVRLLDLARAMVKRAA